MAKEIFVLKGKSGVVVEFSNNEKTLIQQIFIRHLFKHRPLKMNKNSIPVPKKHIAFVVWKIRQVNK